MSAAKQAIYQDLDEAQYLQLQTSLLKIKGSAYQREFLESLEDSQYFVDFVQERVATTDGDRLPVFDGPLTEASFKDLTSDQEQRMYEMWQATPPSVACRVSFWAGVTLEHVRQGKIVEATWLAANGGITESGEERVERALSLEGEAGNGPVDACVRTVLRRMSGLPSARGNKSVFVNPSFGRAWWRERILSRVLMRSDKVEHRENLLEVVRINQTYWEELVTIIVSRGSVFGSTDVQDALINSLAKHMAHHNEQTPLRTVATLQRVARRLSNLSSSIELGALEFSEVGQIVDELLEHVKA